MFLCHLNIFIFFQLINSYNLHISDYLSLKGLCTVHYKTSNMKLLVVWGSTGEISYSRLAVRKSQLLHWMLTTV